MSKIQKKERRSFQDLLHNNKFVMVFSLVVACVIWVGISLTAGTQSTKVIENVPVTFDYENSVPASLKLEMFGDIPRTVSVTVKSKRYIVNTLSAEDITVTAQLDGVLMVGTETIQLKTTKGNKNVEFEIESTSLNSFRAYFDYLRETELPVEAVIDTEKLMPGGYITEIPILSSTTVRVTGPATYVDVAKKILAKAAVKSPLTQTTTLPTGIVGVDGSGNEQPFLTINSGFPITMTIPIFKEATVPVEAAFINAPQGDMAEYVTMTISPQQVRIAGEEKYINQLKALSLGQIDYRDIPVASKIFTFKTSEFQDLRFPDGVKEITVTVQASNVVSAGFILEGKNISLLNVPSAYNVTLLSVDVPNTMLVGPNAEIAGISSSLISGNVDLGNVELKEGEMDVSVSVSVKDRKHVWAYGKTVVKILVTKK